MSLPNAPTISSRSLRIVRLSSRSRSHSCTLAQGLESGIGRRPESLPVECLTGFTTPDQGNTTTDQIRPRVKHGQEER